MTVANNAPTAAKRKRVALTVPTPEGATTVPATKDALDQFLTMMDDPDDWRTLTDAATGKAFKLSREELEIIERIEMNDYADVSYDPYEPYVDFFTHTVMPVPLSLAPEPKRRFVPSKWEALKVAKLVRAIRKGLIKLEEDEQEVGPTVYDLWEGEVDAAILARQARHIEAPKMALPDHRESYNPPEEYLPTPEEVAEWEAMDPEDRPYNFVPHKYQALRHVPGYARLVNERYSRCLDLFLCPRVIKNKLQIDPDDLLPKLPDPRDLRPFPTQRSLDFVGHTAGVPITALTVDPSGQWLLSAARDGAVKLWDTQTGHCRASWKWSKPVTSLAWNPNKALFMFAVAVEECLHLVAPVDMPLTEDTEEALRKLYAQGDAAPLDASKSVLAWNRVRADSELEGVFYSIEHAARIVDVSWHRRGDYFLTLTPDAPSGAQMLTIHQLSRRQSQHPFQKMPGIPRSARFHPTRPHLVLATQKSVRIYDLLKHGLVKKMLPGVQSVSSLALHSGGDNLVVGSHDQRLCWFDLDYSVRPYRALSNHRGAIRSVAFHPVCPLLASAGDDGVVQVIHGRVYDDLATDPLVVPVKTLSDFETGCAATQVVFHPVQPWLFAATSTGRIALFV